MKIAVLCPHFAPDVAPTGEVITRIVLELAALGHELHVVTALPWYRDHAVEPGWDGQLVRHEKVAWGRITRLHPFPTDKGNLPARALAFGVFTLAVTVEATLNRFRPDVILAMSPPLTLGMAGVIAAKRNGIPLVFNIQDVFPDVAVELGRLTQPQVIAVASWLERTSYRFADTVTVLSDDLARNVRAKVGGATPVEVIPNFVDTDWIRPDVDVVDRSPSYRSELGLGDRRVVMYAGNVGFSQSLDLLLGVARLWQARDDVVFVINGSGVAVDSLRQQIEGDGLENVVLAPLQPRWRLPEVLATAEVHLVPLRTGLAKASVPSKLYSILAAGRPILAAVDPGTEVQRTVEAAGAGVCVPPDDLPSFLDALGAMLDDPVGTAQMGRAGRVWVEAWAAPSAVAGAYDRLFESLVPRYVAAHPPG